MDEEDLAWAEEIGKRCTTGDWERNGCELGKIMREFLDRHNMPLTLKAFDDVNCWLA